MHIESGVSLRSHNSFGLPAVAHTLVRIAGDADVRSVVDHPTLGRAPKFVLGGGSNIILTRDMPQVVLKVEVKGRRLVETRPDAWIVEAGAGEPWHDLVMWTLDQGWPGLENLALIPGTVGGLAGAEHRRLRGRTAGPLRIARRGRPAHRIGRDPRSAALRIRVPRQRFQARAGRAGGDHPRALSPAASVAAGAGFTWNSSASWPKRARAIPPPNPARARSPTG